jgi:hypothetical protein
MSDTFPTYGYAKDKDPQIFQLANGEKLPEGWFDSPAAAEAASERAKPPSAPSKPKRG